MSFLKVINIQNPSAPNVAMSFNTVGNVGIGSANPAFTLDVAGAVRSTSNVVTVNAVLSGALYWSDGSSMTSAGNGFSVFDYTGDGVTTSFSTGNYQGVTIGTNVYIQGVYQRKNQYSWVGSNIIFTTPPPPGTAIEIVLVNNVNSMSVPANGSVAPVALSSGGPSWDPQGNVTVGSNLVVGGSGGSWIAGKLGIGTSAAGTWTTTTSSNIVVWGNVVIANTATTGSGVIFPDGTRQTTAAAVFLSSGVAGTIQFAGASNSFTGDGSNFFWDNSNKRLGIGTALPIGNISIVNPLNTGTASDNASLYVSAPNRSAYLQLDALTSGSVVWSKALTEAGRIYYDNTSNYMAFGVNGTAYPASERMRITSTGNVGIGTTVTTVYDGQASGRPLVAVAASSSTTAGASTAALAVFNTDQTAENFAQINFGGLTPNSTNLYSSAIIAASVGPRVSGQYPTGNLIFMTSTTINFAPTEKLRITSQGNVGIGSSTPVQLLDVAGNVNVAGTVIMGSSFLRNRIINGGMQLWQRGTTYSAPVNANNTFIADRWAFVTVNPMAAAQSASVPTTAGSLFPYSLQVQRPFAGTSTSPIYVYQTVESANMYDLAGQTVTLSFWAKAGANFSAAGSLLSVGINTGTVADQGGSGAALGSWLGAASPLATTQAITTTWTRYTFTATLASNVLELATVFYFTPSGTAGADDSFYITGVQLEAGSARTTFERRLYGQELALCQRYYEKSYDTTVNPGSVTSTNAFSLIVSSSLVRYPAFFKVTKRIVNGTITFYSTTGASGNIRNNSASSDLAVTTVTGSNNGYASSNGGTTNNEYIGQWTVDAEL